MGYLHIDNLYKNRAILDFSTCYALEKIHGTSAHISLFKDQIRYFSGGENRERFIALFDEVDLKRRFTILMGELPIDELILYGEAYGGKQQGMRDTYGPDLKFIVFDVKDNEEWLNVPDAERVATALGLEFVYYQKIDTALESLDAARAWPSEQSKRNGVPGPKIQEGVVLRPIFEAVDERGNRIITKHKNDEFKETAKGRALDAEKIVILGGARTVAQEWVTPMRLTHVLDKLGPMGIEETRKVIDAMLEDVKREGEGEIIWSQEVCRAIAKEAAFLFKRHLNALL